MSQLLTLGGAGQLGALGASKPAGGYSGPTPDSLGTKLYAWYNPAIAASVRTGASGVNQAANLDPVSELRDLSGNSRHVVQATSGNQPALRTDGIPRIRFTLDDFLRLSDAVPHGFRVYIACDLQPATGTNIICGFRVNSPMQSGIAVYTASGNYALYHSGGGAPLTIAAASSGMKTLQIMFRIAATNTGQVDGGTAAALQIGADPADCIQLGGVNTGYLDIAEMFIARDPAGNNQFDPLTGQQHTDMTAYIMRPRT